MKDRRYYIRKNGILSEVTYDEYQKYVSHKKLEGNVYFVCIQNSLMEVTEDMYMKHYRVIRRKKYLTREVPYEILHYQSLDTDEMLGEELLYDDSGLSIEDKAIHNIYTDKLYPALVKLTDEERDLLYRLCQSRRRSHCCSKAGRQFYHGNDHDNGGLDRSRHAVPLG